MFGCKQSRSGSQAFVFVCLQLLRQLGASQELPKQPAARAEPTAWLSWGGTASPASHCSAGRAGKGALAARCRRTQPDRGRQCGQGFIAEPGYSAGLQQPLVWASRRQRGATGVQVRDLC